MIFNVYMFMHVRVGVCAMCGVQTTTASPVLGLLFTTSKKASLAGLQLTNYARLAGHLSPDPSRAPSAVPGTQMNTTMPRVLCGCWTLSFTSSCLRAKPSIDWAISPGLVCCGWFALHLFFYSPLTLLWLLMTERWMINVSILCHLWLFLFPIFQ